MSSLDLAEPQALIHTPDSADGDWLHVVLLRRVKDAEWICLQPDASLVTWNLATHRIIAKPLSRDLEVSLHLEVSFC